MNLANLHASVRITDVQLVRTMIAPLATALVATVHLVHNRTMTSGSKRGVAYLGAFIAGATFAVSVSSQDLPAIPAKSGEATGSVQVGGSTVTLKHAYAMSVDAGQYQIILSDNPIPPEAQAKELAMLGGKALLRAGKLSGVTMLVNAKGFMLNVVPFAGSLRGEKMLASAGSIDAFAVTPTGIAGQARKTLEQTMGGGWSFAVSFNAAIVRP